MKTLFLVVGSSGEYSDRLEWPVAAYETEEMARAAAERAMRCSREFSALHDAWYRDVFVPWKAAHPPPPMLLTADENGIRFSDEWLAYNPPRGPEGSPNPYDPEHGRGCDYRVEPVPLLTELPANNPDQHERPEQPRAQDKE